MSAIIEVRDLRKAFRVSERETGRLEDRAQLIATMRLRLGYVARFIEEQAHAGDPGFVRLVGWDTPAKMVDDIAFLDTHRAALERAL